MYKDDVDDDSDNTESSPSKSQKTSKVSAVNESKSIQKEAALVSVTPTPKPRGVTPKSSTSRSDEGVVVKGNQFVALVHRKAVNKGDLSVQKGEILKIHSTREDGWWMAENARGLRGMVPKNILKHCTPTECSRSIPKATKPRKDQVVRISAPRKVKISPDYHNTLECHMSLRLSESNWSFHDLFWNERLKTIQKRHVTTCKMFKIEKLTKYNFGIAEPTGHYLRLCLFDKSAKTGRQVVSNYHYIFPQLIRNNMWVFEPKPKLFHPQYNSQFFLRSNYRMHKVVLMIELFITLKRQGQHLSHAKSFFVEIPILDDGGHLLLRNGITNLNMEATNSAFKDTPTISIRISDIPKESVAFCDMLPDVLVWNPAYFQISAAYRVCLGYFVRNRADPTSAEASFDALLGLYPKLCDQPDMLDILVILCNKKKMNFNSINKDFIEAFNHIFICSVFGIAQLASVPAYNLWDEAALKRREEIFHIFLNSFPNNAQNPLRFQTETKVRPLDIETFSVDLCGPHAID